MPIERLEYQEIDVNLIRRGSSQARQTKVNIEIVDLADSIKIQGLLEPIHLVEIEKNKIYELLDGQRRYLAFLFLAKNNPEKFLKIPSFVYKNTMEPWEKKTLSLQANLSQAPMKKLDKINAITMVYNNFENIKDTVNATGFSDGTVRKYVEIARLPEELKNAINNREISMKAALDAADLYDYEPNTSSNVNIKEMLNTAIEMQGLIGKQKNYIKEIKQQKPNMKISDIIKDVKSKKRIKHDILVSVESDTYTRIDTYSHRESINSIPLAAADLIHYGLDVNEI